MITKAQIKYIQSLQQKKYRDKHKVYIAEGLHIVREAIQRMPDDISLLLLTTKSLPELGENIDKVKERTIKVSGSEFLRVSSRKSPQEVLAVIKIKDIPLPAPGKEELILVLDQIKDPGNMGTIIRLADWFGIRNLVCSPDTVDCYNPKVVQASMGSIFRINISYTALASWLTEMKSRNIKLYGTMLEGDNIYTSKLKLPGMVVLGNEATGISADIVNILDSRLTIPNFSGLPEKTESLNVAMAAAIVCGEFRRTTNT